MGGFGDCDATLRRLELFEELAELGFSLLVLLIGNLPEEVALDLLEDVGHGNRMDPWGNPYVILNYRTHPKEKNRRNDKNLKGLNTYYALFSTGPDGEWKPDLSAEVSRDDIIRANDGGFIGVAERY